jgi:hypothetical protein
MRKLSFIALIIGLFFSHAHNARAVTFTGPPQLVAQANTWQAQAATHVWLGNETVALTTTDLCVGDPAGCSYPGVTYARTRWALYYELGHQLDWAYLTAADHLTLANRWQASGAAWVDSLPGLAAGQEDGLEGVFPLYVMDCALGNGAERDTLLQAFPTGPSVDANNFNTCTYINQIGEAQ